MPETFDKIAIQLKVNGKPRWSAWNPACCWWSYCVKNST